MNDPLTQLIDRFGLPSGFWGGVGVGIIAANALFVLVITAFLVVGAIHL